jgi:hypothetical protein
MICEHACRANDQKEIVPWLRACQTKVIAEAQGSPVTIDNNEEIIDGAAFCAGSSMPPIYQVLLRAVWEDLRFAVVKRIYGAAQVLRPEHLRRNHSVASSHQSSVGFASTIFESVQCAETIGRSRSRPRRLCQNHDTGDRAECVKENPIASSC